MASSMICLHISISITLLLTCLQGGYGVDITLNFIKEPEDVIAKRNQPVLLDCSSSSSPDFGPVNATWYHKGALISDGRRQILNNGSLYIRKVRFKKHPGSSSSATTGIGVGGSTNLNLEASGDDGGPYYCSITNRIGTLVSRQAHVYAASMAKKFTIEPEPALVEEGGVVRFTCQIQAFPVPKYSWQKELNTSEDSDPWIRIPQVDSRFTVLAGGILQISGVLSSDAGNYKCVAHGFEHEQSSSKALLQVVPATFNFQTPTFLSKESTVIVKAGQTAVLECLVSSYPQTEITWNRQGEKVLRTEGVSIYGLGNLMLSSVTLEDDGVYICTSSSKDAEGVEISSIAQVVNLHVQKPPEFIKKPQSFSGPLGRTVRLDCETQGEPKPTITWLKDGRPVDISGRINLRNNELIFSQTITADAGLYQCKAENILGQRLAVVRVQVVIGADQPGPPTSLSAVTRSNSSIELFWVPSVSPNHPPIRAFTIHYILTSGGQENTVVSVNTSSTIEKLKPYTNYTFYVRAWTGRSPSEPSDTISWMTGEDIPLAAPAVVLSSNLTSLHITWDELPPSVARGIITKYKIQWRKKNHGSFNVLEVFGNKREHTVSGLRPGNEYDVRVLAATKMGYPILPDSNWPWVTHAMPNHIKPHVPLPPNLQLNVINFSTVNATWKASEENDCQAIGFILRYGKQNQKALKSYKLLSNVSHFFITDLESHSLYEVRIYGFNENGNGTESVGVIATPVSGQSDDNKMHNNWYVLEPPTELEAIATSAKTIRLSWKPPLTNKNISFYTVRYNPVHNTSDFNTSVVKYFNIDKLEMDLEDLMPYTQYEFSVRSNDPEDKPGPYSSKVECKTLEDVPTAPQELRWFPHDLHSIRVTWQPPRYPNGVIISYDVLYKLAYEPQALPEDWTLEGLTMMNVSGTESTSLVHGLDSNAMYYLCVRAETRAGRGPPTNTITLKIPQVIITRNETMPVLDDDFQESNISIIVGVSIGVCCMMICAFIIIFRNRCFPSPPAAEHRGLHSHGWENGYAHHNGNGNGHIPREYRISSSESHEMDSITPMLTSIPETTSIHLDTKGGYIPVIPYANGNENHKEAEGSCGPTGSQTLLINITSNPQFEMSIEADYNGDKDRSQSKLSDGYSSSSALLLDKNSENTSGSLEGNQSSPTNATYSSSNPETRDKSSPSSNRLSTSKNDLPEMNCHRQQQRPSSQHSGSHKPHHNHHPNQSSKHSKRNSAPSNSGNCRNNSSQIPTSISPSSTTISTSKSPLSTPHSSSSTVVIIPTVTKNGHHTNGKGGGRKWRPLSHTAISATPTKITGQNSSNGSCIAMGNGVLRPKSGEFVKTNGSSGGGVSNSANADHSESKVKPFSNSYPSSYPPSPSDLSLTSQSQSPSHKSHLLCATNNTDSHKLVVQT